MERENPLNGKIDPWLRCMLWGTFWGTRDSDGIMDCPVVTPCHHIFGEKCIKQRLAFGTDASNANDCRSCPKCGRSLVYRDCGHTIKPRQFDLFDTDGIKWAELNWTSLAPLEEHQLSEKCLPCSSKMLRFRTIYSELEKTLIHYQTRRAWLINGVTKRGLSQHLLDEVNGDIGKCQADMKDLKPSVTDEWQEFLRQRWGW